MKRDKSAKRYDGERPIFSLTVINYGQDASPIPSSGHPTEEEEQRNPEIYRLRDTFE